MNVHKRSTLLVPSICNFCRRNALTALKAGRVDAPGNAGSGDGRGSNPSLEDMEGEEDNDMHTGGGEVGTARTVAWALVCSTRTLLEWE